VSVGGDGVALLAASAGVAFGHAILPDHWVPLAVVGRTRRYSLKRVTRLSGAAGVAHVLVSFVLGAIVVVVGLQFRSTIESVQGVIVGGLLIVTGLAFAGLELTGHGHHHEDGHGHGDAHSDSHRHGHFHDHEQAHDHGVGHDHDGHDHGHTAAPRSSGLVSVMVPFGAAASPDLTILPVFLAAATAGIGIAIGSLLIFAAVTIGTIVGLTVAATRGGYELQGNWLERWGNAFTALVLVIIGALVLTGVI
jgi:nickel/cobalt transporter (NicO) family protein